LEKGLNEEALNVGRESFVLCRALNYTMLEALVAFHIGRIHTLTNKSNQARERFNQALKLGHQLNHAAIISKSEEFLRIIADSISIQPSL
jgi:hypothetical protein